MAAGAEVRSLRRRLDDLSRHEKEQGLWPHRSCMALHSDSGLKAESVDMEVMGEYLSNCNRVLESAGDDVDHEVARAATEILAGRLRISAKLHGLLASMEELRAEAIKIDEQKAAVQALMGTALDHLHDAYRAFDTIRKADIVEIKANRNPCSIVKFVFDGLLLLQSKPILPVTPLPAIINRIECVFVADSFKEFGTPEVSKLDFLISLRRFLHVDANQAINDETWELLEPYLRFDSDPAKHWGPWPTCVLDPEIAGRASGAAIVFCRMIHGLKAYSAACRRLKPSPCDVVVMERRLHVRYRSSQQERAALHSMMKAAESQEEPLFEALRAGDAPGPGACARAINSHELAAAATMPFTLAGLEARERAVFIAMFPTVRIDLSAASGDVLELSVDTREPFASIKQQVLSQWQIPPMCQALFLGEAQPRNEDILADHVATLVNHEQSADPISMTLLVSCGDIYSHLQRGRANPVKFQEAALALECMAQTDCERAFAACAKQCSMADASSDLIRTLAPVIESGGTIPDRSPAMLSNTSTDAVTLWCALAVEREDSVAKHLLLDLLFAGDSTVREPAFRALIKDGGQFLCANFVKSRDHVGDPSILETLDWIMSRAEGAAVWQNKLVETERMMLFLLGCIPPQGHFWRHKSMSERCQFQETAVRIATRLFPDRSDRIISAVSRAYTHAAMRTSSLRCATQIVEELGDSIPAPALLDMMSLRDNALRELTFTALSKDGSWSWCRTLVEKLWGDSRDDGLVQTLDWAMSKAEGGAAFRDELLRTDSLLGHLLVCIMGWRRDFVGERLDESELSRFQQAALRIAIRLFPAQAGRVNTAILVACQDPRLPVRTTGHRMAAQMVEDLGDSIPASSLLDLMTSKDNPARGCAFRVLCKDGGQFLCGNLPGRMGGHARDVGCVQALDWIMGRAGGAAVLQNELLCTDSLLRHLLKCITGWRNDCSLLDREARRCQEAALRIANRLFPDQSERIIAAVLSACEDRRPSVKTTGFRMVEQMIPTGHAGLAIQLEANLSDTDPMTRLRALQGLSQFELDLEARGRILKSVSACCEADWPCVRRAANTLLQRLRC